MYILQFSPPPRQCTDYLSFPIIFEPIRQFVGYKKPRGAGQTPSVKPCGFATSLSEGGSGENGSFAPEPEALPPGKAPSLRGLSPQATGGVCS